MIEVYWDKVFKERYNEAIKNDPVLKTVFWQNVGFFLDDPHDPYIGIQMLSNGLEDYCAAHIFDFRIIFKFIDDESVLLIDINKFDCL